ncbi:SRPBCC family protein [Flavobacterium sp. TMP13]|uniref:SRPBCC family protein n=1 Tax=Flavobacterium sp. TMP13 TaxID=3425950 RepID=UPI003D770E39
MEATTHKSGFSLQSILPKKNISTTERILMVAGGAYFLYKILSKKDKSTAKTTLAGSMLVRGLTGYCPVYQAVDAYKNTSTSNVNIRVTGIVNRPILQVYAFWRNLENLPKFMNHLESVTAIDTKRSEWTAKGPFGVGTVTWKAEIVKDEKDKFLSWKSLPGSTIENFGKVGFKPIGQATEIDVTISYKAPLGIAGEQGAKLLNPIFEKMVQDDIENLKSYMESGQH